MKQFKDSFKSEIQKLQKEIKEILENKGDVEIGKVTISHLFRGLRGLPLAYTPNSSVDLYKGVSYRSIPINEVHKILPTYADTGQPSIESLFLYLLTGKVPTETEVETLRLNLHAISHVQHYVFNAIDSLPPETPPMTRFCIGILAASNSSQFQEEYDKGLAKSDHWQYAFDDAINLIAKLPRIAGYIYRKHCKNTSDIEPDYTLDWAGNLAHMMGYDDIDTQNLMRLYIFTHAEHGATNVSAHTARLVGSSLSNVFYSYVASMLGLAGPLHGHASEQSVKWLLEVKDACKKSNKSVTDVDFLRNYVEAYLNKGYVIPGYGHAALRVEDPRFTVFYELVEKQGISEEIVNLVKTLYKIVPAILKKQGKATNVNPNVDAITGAVLHSKGIVEDNFYTVLFGVSRLIGVSAQYIVDKALLMPLERPATLSNNLFDK